MEAVGSPFLIMEPVVVVYSLTGKTVLLALVDLLLLTTEWVEMERILTTVTEDLVAEALVAMDILAGEADTPEDPVKIVGILMGVVPTIQEPIKTIRLERMKDMER